MDRPETRKVVTRTAEPRVVCDGLVWHWRHVVRGTWCGTAPMGPLMPASSAGDKGLTECPDCSALASEAIL